MQSFQKNILLILSSLIIGSVLLESNAQNQKIDSLKNLLKQHSVIDTVRIDLLIDIAHESSRIAIDKSLEYAQEVDSLSSIINYKKGNAESLKLFGIYYFLKSNYPKALEYFQKLLIISEELGDKKGISHAYNNIGVTYESQGNYLKALEYYQKSLKIKEDLGDKKGISHVYTNIGIICRSQGDYPKALEYYQKSLKISEELGERNEISNAYNNIGIIYKSQGNYPKALEHYQKSLKIKKELGDKKGISSTYNNIGNIQRSLGNYPEALEYYQNSLKISEELGNKKGISHTYNNIGITYRFQGNYPKALEYYQKSLKVSIEIGDKSFEALTYKELGLMNLKQKNIKEAYNYSKKAYVIAEEIGKANLLKNSSKILAKSSEALGLYKEAYTYHVVYKTMNDSLYNEENIKKLSDLEHQFKYEKEKQATELEQQKKDALNAKELKQQKTMRNTFILGFVFMSLLVFFILYSFLQKRKANRVLQVQKNKIEENNTELLLKNEEIQAQDEELLNTNATLLELNATKNKFFSIIAHDLRSPFSSLLGFSGLLLEEHKQLDDEEQEQIIKSINSSATNTFKLLENLLTWSRSQTGRIEYSPQEIKVKTLIDDVVLFSQPTAKNKNIRLLDEVEIDTLVYVDDNMIKTVLRNLISNAIKFTKKNGIITVLASKAKKQGFLEVTVRDNGVGIPKNKVADIFRIDSDASTKGTENESGTGLGLILCKEFVEKNKGEIWVKSEEGKGSEFIFSLPLAAQKNN